MPNTDPHPAQSSPAPAPTWAAAIVDTMPWGAAIVGRDGVIVAGNAALDDVLGWSAIGRRCCEALGCEAAEGTCVTARESGSAERLISLPRARSAWLTTRPLEGGETIVYLRQAEVPVASAVTTTITPTPGPPRVEFSVLGQCQVEHSSAGPLSGAWLEQRPGQLLRFLVATRGRAVSVDEIAEALWPGGERRSPATVRYLVHTLRERLEPHRGNREPSPYVVSHRGGYRLNDDLVALDVDHFEREANDGLAAHRAGGHDLARRLLERALSRYRGEFLAEDAYAEWALAEREQMRWLLALVLRALADLALQADDLDRATDRLARLTELEPLDIDVQRDLIELCLRRGRPSEATRRYNVLCRRLEEAYGRADPGFAITPGRDGRLAIA